MMGRESGKEKRREFSVRVERKDNRENPIQDGGRKIRIEQSLIRVERERESARERE